MDESLIKCKGETKKKTACKFNAVSDGYCKHHHPDKNKDNENCSICCDLILAKPTSKSVWVLECKHMFHTKCLKEWEKIQATCPVCRTYIKTTPEGEQKRQEEQTTRREQRLREQEDEDFLLAVRMQYQDNNRHDNRYLNLFSFFMMPLFEYPPR